MTEPDDFFSRWSRRKRASAEESKRDRPAAPDAEPLPNTAVPAGGAKPQDAGPDGAKAQAEFDLSTLPSLDSIGPATDIRIFLQPGVPAALSRAALRRAWSADPAIRDFIGLSENAWDFTATDEIHGFGALDPAEAQRLFAQLMDESDSRNAREAEAQVAATDTRAADAEQAQSDAAEPTSSNAAHAAGPADDGNPVNELPQSGNVSSFDVAAQQPEDVARERPAMSGRRAHGRALPQ